MDRPVRLLVGQRLLQPRLDALALLQSFGDDHELREEVVGELDIERQIEANGALSDVCTPMVDVLIICQKLFQLGRDVRCCVDRRAFRELQVDEKLGAVRRREELLWNKAHSVERQAEQRECRQNHKPSGSHRQGEKPAEHAHDRAGYLRRLRWAS